MTSPKIELIDVYKSFGSKQVLGGVNLKVETGQSLVVIGGSGTGKSVMLKCILGLLHPDGGTINIDGKPIHGFGSKRNGDLMSKFGMLFQGGALFDSLPVWQNVAFSVLYGKSKLSAKLAKELAVANLAKVGLAPEIGDLMPAELSGGMQKRVGLARAIAKDPEIIFFDEPTTGLDPIMADVINDLIVDAVQSLGATTLSITHDMASARKIADVIAMIHKGRIIWSGPAESIDHSGNEMVEQFIHGRAQGPIRMEVLKT